jgi:hypothetical protein
VIWYDYPTNPEAAAIWSYYKARYNLTGQPTPSNAQNWVGREIESCCERAYLWNVTLAEAAKTVVPACIANGPKIEAMRRAANNRYLSAAAPGIYNVQLTAAALSQPTGRTITND